jgi:hypothetical protein
MSNAGEARGVGTGRGSRLPRWTRQEILVLIEGKRVVERSGRGRGRGRVRGGEGAGAGGAAAEPTKWAAVAEYCRRHGVDRGPVQCRKRWSNLAGDYKKIREWERGYAARKEASFWAMRNDARRERRLPGFFDQEVYDILEGRGAGNAAALEDAEAKEEEEVKAKAVLHTGRGIQGGGLFSSSEDEDDQEDDAATPSPTPTPTPAPAPAPAAVVVPIPGEQAVPFFARASSLSVHGELFVPFLLLLLSWRKIAVLSAWKSFNSCIEAARCDARNRRPPAAGAGARPGRELVREEDRIRIKEQEKRGGKEKGKKKN